MPRRASSAKAMKGRNPVAQGNALGSMANNAPGPEGAEQGELPEGWAHLTVGEVASNSCASRAIATASSAGIPFIPMALLPQDGSVTTQWELRKPEEVRSGVPFTDGDVLLAKITPCLENGKLGIARGVPGGWGMTSTEVYPLRPVKVTAEFLAAFLTQPAIRHVLASKMQGATGRQRLPKEALDSFPITVPPLPEQRAIAEVLRVVQRAKEATEKVITATRQLKASLMKHLFTYGPVPLDQAAYIPLKETAIGTMPAAWSVARVGEIGEVVTGTTPSTKRPEFYGGPHMFITPGDMGARKYIAQTEKWLTDVGLAECRALPKNAVVVVCIGATIGKTGLTGADSCATNQQCNSVIASEQVDPEFLFYGLSNRAPALPPLASRAAVPIVNKSNFCEFQVALPLLSEQREIAAQLPAVDGKLAAEERRREALGGLFKSVLHHLMTGKLRLLEVVRSK